MVLEKMVDSDTVLVEISNRHVHLSEQHLAQLFGTGYQLTIKNFLSQPGQYAAEERVDLEYQGRELKKVRIIGPTREQTQVEISATESRLLGINAPCRLSGDIKGTPGITVVGPLGKIEINEGVIIARRHIHVPHDIAASFGVRDNQQVSVYVPGERPVTYHDIIVRTGSPEKTALAVHLDSDEGNSALLNGSQYGKLII